MKKVSTVAAMQSRNFSQPKLTIGLDLGDRSSWYCLLDEVGEVLQEQKLSTTPKAMREVFGSMPHCRMALETGMHSPWVSRVLSELGLEVIVAHERTHPRMQPTDRRVGADKPSAGGATETDQRSGHADRADVPADAGRRAPLSQKPGRGLLPGPAAGAKKLWAKRTAAAH